MSTTKMTLQERSNLMSAAMKQARLSRMSTYQREKEVEKQEKEERQNALIRAGATALDFSSNLLEGVTRSLEGIYDFGAGIVGAVGGAFDNDFRDSVEEHVKYDFTSDLFGRDGEEGIFSHDRGWLDDASYLKQDGIINQMAQGVGGMLPSVAITVLTGGAGGAIAAAGKTASSLAFMGGAAGGKFQEALQKGAGYHQALGYGAAAGAIEGLTEQIGGVAMGGSTQLAESALGRYLISKGKDELVRKGVGKMAYTFASEGAEEILSDLLDPINKKVFGIDDVDPTDWKEVFSGLPKTFVVGGATGVVMGGLESGVSAIRNSDKGGTKFNKIADDMQIIEDVTRASEAVKQSTKATQEKVDRVETYAAKRIKQSLDSLSATAQTLTAEQRQNLFSDAPILADYLSEDGTLHPDVIEQMDAQITGGRASNTSDTVLNAKKEQETLDRISQDSGAKFTLDTDPLSADERTAMAKLLKSAKGIGEKGTDKRVVLVRSDDSNVKAFQRGNTIYMTRENLTNGKWSDKAIHETGHTLEATKEYRELSDELAKDENALNGAVETVADAYAEGDRQAVLSAWEKEAAGEALSEREQEYVYEVMARMVETALGGEASVSRIARKNKGLANRLLNGINDAIEYAGSKDKQQLVKLRRWQRLFEKALEADRKNAAAIANESEASRQQYLRDRNAYLQLKESEREKWLRDRKYTADDFAPGVLEQEDLRTLPEQYREEYAKATQSKKETPVSQDAVSAAFSKESASRGRQYTDGEISRRVADLAGIKTYSKKYASQFIDYIIEDNLSMQDEHSWVKGKLYGKDHRAVVENLFEKLNAVEPGYRAGVALNIADYIIDHAVMQEVYSDLSVTDDEIQQAKNIIDIMSYYRHGVNLDPIKGEIKHKFDKQAGAIFLQWGKRKGEKGYSADYLLAPFEEAGSPIRSENEAEIFFEALEKYDNARKLLQRRSKNVKLIAYGSKEELNAMRQKIASQVLAAYEGGDDSAFSAFMKKVDTLKKDAKEAEKKANYIHSISMKADELRAMTDRKYAQAHDLPYNVLNDETFKVLAKTASGIFQNGKISAKKLRESMGALCKFYSYESNEIYRDFVDSISSEDHAQTVKDAVERCFADFAENYNAETEEWSDAPLSLAELKAAERILCLTKQMYTTYDAVYEDGKRFKIDELAAAYQKVGDISETIRVSSSHALWNGIKNGLTNFKMLISSPLVVARHMDAYNDGFYTHYVRRLQADSWRMQRKAIELTQKADEFLKQHKEYAKRLTTERVNVYGVDLLVGEAIDLYMQASQRNAAQTLFAENGGGFIYTKEDGKDSMQVKWLKKNRNMMEVAFNDEDLAFIKILKDIYKECGTLKKEMDFKLLGFTTVEEKFEYYTITRDPHYFTTNIGDARSAMRDIMAVNNLKENKTRSKNAHVAPLRATDAYTKMIEHVRHMTMYNSFAEDIGNFNRIWNRNTNDKNRGEYSTLRLQGNRIWKDSYSYFRKYLNDIQGVRTGEKSGASRLFAKMRSNYAKAALSVNVKVVVGQTASYLTAGSGIDADVLAKALTIKSDWSDMDKYCDTSFIRSHDLTVVKAETLTDKIGKIAEYGSKGIQMADRATIGKLWVACQLQIAKNGDGEFGTVENKKAAADLLNTIVTDTQPTYQAADRSAFQRSENEVTKSLAMFTSVGMKQASMVLGAVDKVLTTKAMLKAGVEGVTAEDLKIAKKELRRTLASVLASNLLYALMCQACLWLFDRDDPEDNNGKNAVEQIASQFVSTNISMFPIAKELYSFFSDGYDVQINQLSLINDLMSSVRSMYSSTADAVTGEGLTAKNARALRTFVFSVSNLLGIPTRNVYNLVSGLTKRVSPTAYYNSFGTLFTTPSTSDITGAWKKNNQKLARSAANKVMLTRGFDVSNEQAEILARMVKNGRSLPASSPSNVTVDGETVSMTKNQQATFAAVYSRAADAVDDAIERGLFEGLTEEQQAGALSLTYRFYYQSAEVEALGVEASKLYLVGTAIPIAQLAKAVAELSGITGTNKKAIITTYIRKLNLTAVQKYILMGYFGYRNEKGEASVKSYINRLDLTQSEKKALLKYSGY